MRVVNIHEAKTQLSKLIQAALDGEDIVIAKGNEPLVELRVVASARRQRELGWAQGLVDVADDFDAPLEDFSDYQ